LPPAAREAEARRLAAAEARQPFDLARGPLLRATLVRLAGEEHVGLFTMHHIVSDGWSMGVLIRELTALREAFSQGQPSPLGELVVQYADYAAWQRQWLVGEVLEEKLRYWRDQLAGVPRLELPTDRPRPAVQTYRGTTRLIHLTTELGESLVRLSRGQGATLFMTLLAGFQALLARTTGQEDIAVGTPIAGRNHREIEELIGFFVNTLVLRTDLAGNPTFRELLGRVRQVALDGYAHQETPFERLVEEVEPDRDMSTSPLFQVMFTLQNAPQGPEPSGSTLDAGGVEWTTAKFDLLLGLQESAAGVVGGIEYNTDLFDDTTIRRLIAHFERLLQGIAEDPERRLSELVWLPAAERHQLLVDWNATAIAVAGAELIHELFERQAERSPDAIAVVCDAPASRERLSYRELDRRANQLAHHLRARYAGPLGVGPGAEARVGVCAGRSSKLLVALLGILKSGAAYVPLDPAYPPERLAFMLEDAGVRMLVTEERFLDELPELTMPAVCLDRDWAAIAAQTTAHPGRPAVADNLAYLIYTSGSTGRPKGVAIAHRSTVAMLAWAREVFSAEELAGVLGSTSVCFDISVFEIFAPLAWGGRVILVRDALALESLPAAGELRLINTVPSAMTELVRTAAVPASVCTVNLAGEVLKGALVERLYRQPTIRRVLNLYGPSEDTTYSTFVQIERGEGEPTIGRPVAGTRAYVLDRWGRPGALGVVGELFIGGDGLARGYLHRAELTAERFLPDPLGAEVGGRLYRTGDLARWRTDGTLEFLGRRDHQVKLRGFRIELGEIEAVLSRRDAVRDTVVVVREDTPGDRRLVAYLVVEGPPPVSAELREALKEALPDYMVPSAFVVLEALPLNPNGKVDRAALPAPERRGVEVGYVAPADPDEELLAEIWAAVLAVDRVGARDNFFELGGHSLLATQVVSRVRDAFGVELALQRLFEAPTLTELAAVVRTLRQEAHGVPAPPIVPFSRDRELPLSFAQQRLWFLDQFEPGSSAYNIPQAVRLGEAVVPGLLARVFNEVVRRHEVLRTSFAMEGGRPRQVIAGELELPLPVVDLAALPAPRREAEARRLAAEEAQRPFDLTADPLLRCTLLRLAARDQVVLMTMHHIASDAWSFELLQRELEWLYGAFSQGQPSPLPELPVQYADFAHWQRQWLAGEVLEAELGYWRDQLAGAPRPELPTDRPRPAMQTFRGRNLPLSLPEELPEALEALARSQGATVFMTLLAAFKTLLSRFTGQTDVVVGTPIAGRNRREIEDLIGFFVNTLVLRSDLAGGPAFLELLARVRQVALDAYAHQDLPFERLVEELQPERDLGSNPLFQVMFVLQNAPQGSAGAAQLRLRAMTVEGVTAKFDLTLFLSQAGRGGTLEYNTDLFDATTMERLAAHFARLVRGIVEDPQRRLGDLPLVSAAEAHQLLVAWSDTRTADPSPAGIHELAAAQAARTPEAVALVLGEERWSYRELDRRSNQLAHHLRALGVGPDTTVGVALARSCEAVAALVGVLKAGGAFVPLDRSYPAPRLAFMLADARVEVLVTSREILAELPSHEARTVLLDADRDRIAGASAQPLASAVAAENLSYLIYTSGSTGRPKGVALVHRTLTNLIAWQLARSAPASRTLQFAPMSFDVYLQEVFSTLSSGGTLVLLRDLERRDPVQLAELMTARGIERLFLPFVALQQLAEVAAQSPPPALREVITAGEQLQITRQVERLFTAGGCTLENQYGPSESHVVTAWPLAGPASEWPALPSIGRPVANFRVYLLDGRRRPVPLGVAGELFLAGEGLARGYYDRPELTAETFLPDPLSGDPFRGDPFRGTGERMYATGDLGRFAADGTIEFLGRIDHQVKVRGFRIELGEIEAVLSHSASVRECAVVARGDGPGGRQLAAYVVTEPGSATEPRDLRELLQQRLPEYMVPSAFVFLEALPLLPSGKVNRAVLPAPERHGAEAEFVAPSGPTEELLAGIWAAVLDLDRIGAEDNFFELGGHSLLATQVISRLRDVFGVELPLHQLFEAPTVARLAPAITAARALRGRVAPPLRPQARHADLPLSFAQQRLWFFDQFHPGSAVYNMPSAVPLSGRLDGAVLRRSLNEIVRRHEALRTSFGEVGGQPVQVIAPALELALPVVDLEALPPEAREAEARRLAAAEARQPFDLARGPLLRATLVRLAKEEHVGLFTMHHIVSDGWSIGVLIRELTALQEALSQGQPSPLGELVVQYADYAAWQRQWLVGEVLGTQLNYWREKLAGAPARLELPTDRPRPAVQSYRGHSLAVALSEELSAAVNALSRRRSATPFMTLLAAFKALLHRFTGEDDLVVGTPIAGRTHREIEGLIGFFVNTLVLRTVVGGSGDPGYGHPGGQTYERLLEQVRQVALDAYAHQDIPFEQLVEELRPERDLSSTPLFQVMFILQNVPQGDVEMPALAMSPLAAEGATTKFDLTLSVQEDERGWSGTLSYRSDLFDRTTIARLRAHFGRLLAGVVEDPERRIGELTLLSAAERHQILIAWNDVPDLDPQGLLFHELFEAQVEACPEAVAVVFHRPQLDANADSERLVGRCPSLLHRTVVHPPQQAVSYRELDRRANRLAVRLRELGVGGPASRPEEIVGVCLERSPELIAGLLAILKAGGAYLPLDPEDPPARLAYLLEDSGVSVVLAEEQTAGTLPAAALAGMDVISDWDFAAPGEAPNPVSGVTASQRAYLIYTSGSTGRPKGVSVEHRSLVDFLEWVDRELLGARTRTVPLVNSISFDASLKQLFGPLLRGAPVVVLSKETVAEPAALLAALDAAALEALNCVPSLWAALLGAMESGEAAVPAALRTLWLGGEELREDLVRRTRALRPELEIGNAYGPTEATSLSSWAPRLGAGRPTIGRPLANTRLYVLDGTLRPVPMGVTGELAIAGPGVARGYLRRPGLTAARFVPNPFSGDPFGGVAGMRLYRTGDRVRSLRDGRLEYLGRSDHQIQLRGFRIELGEIESVLAAHAAVRECVVVARGDGLSGALPARLVAYVATGDAAPEVGELRAFARRSLPKTMVPATFVVLEALPHLPSGKVDRGALPEPEVS
ncbi:MAG: amino acid adenylation domain-containing protein, partial [bacterium]|nr:amino acid adenylation domain-containing protein [bacterium]